MEYIVLLLTQLGFSQVSTVYIFDTSSRVTENHDYIWTWYALFGKGLFFLSIEYMYFSAEAHAQ